MTSFHWSQEENWPGWSTPTLVSRSTCRWSPCQSCSAVTIVTPSSIDTGLRSPWSSSAVFSGSWEFHLLPELKCRVLTFDWFSITLIFQLFTEHCSGALRLPFAAIRLPESVTSCQGGRALLQVVYHHLDSRFNVWKAVFKDVIWFFCSQEQFCVLAHR